MSNVISIFLPGSEFDRAAEGLLGAAGCLAEQLGLPHVVVSAGATDQLLSAAAKYADRVLQLTNPELTEYQPETCLAALHAVCHEQSANAVLLGQDTWSQELTPRLARRLNGCSIGDAQQLNVTDGRIRATRSVYGGKATAVVQANADVVVVWVRARAFASAAARSAPGNIEPVSATIEGDVTRTQIVARHAEEATGVRLEDAPVILSGGRGLGGPEPFEDLRELASVCKAEVGASRAACDAGWVAPGLQIGQTGKKVAPELYIAVAISGASQHLMGIADAKSVCAINTDPDAPIFKHCKFGIVDDWKAVVGPLKNKLRDLL